MFLRLFLRLLFLCISVSLLSNCTKITDSHLKVNSKVASPYTMSAQAYLAMAANQTGTEQQALYIMAAGRSIDEGNWQDGLSILNKMKDLPSDLANEKNILLAKIDIVRGHSHEALMKLASVREINSLPIYYAVQYHEMLAYIYQSTGHSTEAVSERIQLGHLLPDNVSQTNNLRVLWLNVATLPVAELETMAVEAPEGSELQGWMQLALISRRTYSHPDDLLTLLENWQKEHPQHPGNLILPHPLLNIRSRLFPPPKEIALLLPVTGSLSGPANAIRDGFMAAYQSSGKNNIHVRLYDTNATSVAKVYQQAISEGAEYIVGPLSKPDVATVAALPHPVPTLLLNDLDVQTGDNAYLFGLSPAQEARQVAAKIRKSGHSQLLVIAPQGGWGDEILTVFNQQWQANGGKVVDTLRYSSQEDLSQKVREFLHVSESEAFGKKSKEDVKNIEVKPQRREDFDSIFLLAYPSMARQIMPLLRYYFAGNVPVFATSSVYGGSPNVMKDRDLNGIMFVDMPWVFNHQLANKNWPEQLNSYNRLYALGMDSYALATQLNQLLLFPAMGVNDQSGVLYLNANQQIARILVWGQFKQGEARLLSN